MNTDQLHVSGFDESRVATDQTYLSVFLCGLCCRLVSLDSVVSDCCHQPFCKACIEAYELECSTCQDKYACPCPCCHTVLRVQRSNEIKNYSSQFCCEILAVKMMEKSQPLAFKILKTTTIACIHNSCTWTGNYSDFVTHSFEHQNINRKSRLPNSFISTNDMGEYKKERSRSSFVSETKQSERSTPERAQKSRKMRAFSIDSTSMLDVAIRFQETEQGFTVDSETCPLQGESSQNDEANGNGNGTTTIKSHKQQEIFAKAEKLKKQANAKFNLGNYLDARSLYTDGINAVKGVKVNTEDDLKLLSDMLSNRAATYYCYKEFDRCIQDCEDAIRYEPTIDKAWIRKWRALMVKGEFHIAHCFLEEGVATLPESNRIREEYHKSANDMETITLLKQFMENGDQANAEKILNDSMEISTCDNVLLLKYCAEVMIANGETDGAIKYIDRALGLNPMYDDCLELQGLVYYYDGNMKKAVKILTESCKKNGNSVVLQNALTRIQTRHELYSIAKVHMQHGRHEEADTLLTDLIQACESLPTKSLLFSVLRADRANNYLQMQRYVFALKDCQDVIDVNHEFAQIWNIRSDALLEIGEAAVARKELQQICKTWGKGNTTFESKYHKVDMEIRISCANNELFALQKTLEDGTCGILPVAIFSDSLITKPTGSHSKRVKKIDVESPNSNSLKGIASTQKEKKVVRK